MQVDKNSIKKNNLNFQTSVYRKNKAEKNSLPYLISNEVILRQSFSDLK
jgi:hypothetical protein